MEKQYSTRVSLMAGLGVLLALDTAIFQKERSAFVESEEILEEGCAFSHMAKSLQGTLIQ